jgi:hypothetical protein
LHLLAGWRERAGDRRAGAGGKGWLKVGPPLSIPDKGARIVAGPDGERIAGFRDGAQIGALSNLCAHQNGPIGEGRIIDGCVTLSLARLPVPAGGRLLTAAVHGEARHVSRAGQPRRGRSRSAAATAGHTGIDQVWVR